MTDIPQNDLLKAELSSGWLTLSLNDPGRRNALSEGMASALSSALHAVRDDRAVRGITLRGEGGIFCAGGDLKGMASHIMQGDRAAIEAMSRSAGELFHQLAHQPQPVIALVEGAAMAGGLGLMCCADIIAVTADAQFALTETRLGIPPAQIMPFLLARMGGPATRRLVLTGAKFVGEEAARIGLADHVAQDAAGLAGFERETRRQVLACAPGANAASKALALRIASLPAEEATREAAAVFTDCLLSDEGREGIASFVGKRKPGWADDV